MMNRWLTILLIWYMWITASSIMMLYIGIFHQFEYSIAITYMAIPTFVYFVYSAKQNHSTNLSGRQNENDIYPRTMPE